MKKIKNVMLLAVGSITVMTIALVSCKKDSTATTVSAPTIVSITPTSDSLNQKVTIIGTNLKGASVTIGGVTPTASDSLTISANGDTITVKIPSTVSIGGSVAVVVTVSGATPVSTTISVGLAAIDGFTSSNGVDSTSLIAHWSFDVNTDEDLSLTAPNGTVTGTPGISGGTATIVAGKIGHAVQLTNGWLTYPGLAVTSTDNSGHGYNDNDTLANGFTISMWAQLPVQTNYTGLFQLSGVSNTNTWPLAGFGYHKNTSGSTTKIDIDGGITNVDGTTPYVHSTQAGGFSTSASNGPGLVTDSLSWVFLTMVYDTTGGGQIVYYGNGAFIGSVAVGSTLFLVPEVELLQTPNYATIGAITSSESFPGTGTSGINPAPGWASTRISATLDDIRLYRKTLTAQHVADLFALGNQGR